MKIHPIHYDKLAQAFKPYQEAYALCVNEFAKNPKIKDKHQAARWQVLRMAGMMGFVCDTLYTYMNDENIDNALKKITKPWLYSLAN